MGILVTRDYDRWDSAERERGRERGQGIDFFLKQICTKNLLPVFPSPRFIIFFSTHILLLPFLPHDAKEGQRKKKKKKTRKTHSPHLTLHQCGIYIKPNSPPPLPGGSSLYIQQQHHISIPLIIIVIERDRLVDLFNKVCKPLAHMNRDQESQEGKMASPTMV